MSNYQFTEQEAKIRVIAKLKNPYAAECPNKQLWSEGYVNGYEDCIKNNFEETRLSFEAKEAECESLRQQLREMIEKIKM